MEDLPEQSNSEALAFLREYAQPLPIDAAGVHLDAAADVLTAGFALTTDMATVSLLLSYAANLDRVGWDERGLLDQLRQRGVTPPVALTAARELQRFARAVVTRALAVPTAVPGPNVDPPPGAEPA